MCCLLAVDSFAFGNLGQGEKVEGSSGEPTADELLVYNFLFRSSHFGLSQVISYAKAKQSKQPTAQGARCVIS